MQAFGIHRYHERRATGRKGASLAFVLLRMGRLVARQAAEPQEVPATDLTGADLMAWRVLRAQLGGRQ